jgi:genome maintenance exonuclease 1
MKHNPLFHYPSLTRVTKASGSRYYVCPDTGQKLPSTTTILSGTADKSFLKEWIERVGETEAERLRTVGSDLGTLMHERLERYMCNIPETLPASFGLAKTAEMMAGLIIEHGLKHVDEVWGIETPLYYPGLYAGTTDVVGVYKGKPAIMDFKSAKKMRMRSQIGDYCHQLSAYRIAHNEKYGTKIDTGVIFMASRDGGYETFVYDRDEMIQGSSDFLERVYKYLSVHA